MAKKRKSSSNSRLTTKAPTTAPMRIKAPPPAAASTPAAAVSTPAVPASTSAGVAAATPVIAVAAPPVATVKTEILVDREAIAQRAFARFVARGCTHGHALEDWLAAEAELHTHAAP